MKYTFVQNAESLTDMIAHLRQFDVIGFDLECENNLHHYGVYITIMQISVPDKDYIVDVQEMQKEDLDPLLDLLEDEKHIKIFHDVSFDFRVLQDQFDCHVKGLFDSQLAAAFTGETNLGLGALLEKYFDVKKQRKFQMADWTKRPLTDGMLSYAVKDSKYLIQLKDVLEKKLKELGRLSWVQAEFRHLESMDWKLPYQTYEQFPKFVHYTENQRGGIKALYELRDVMAKKVNRPIHFIMNNKRLVSFVLNPPSIKEWQNMGGVHPIVKSKGKAFYMALEEGLKEQIVVQRKVPKKANVQQKKEADQLLDLRNALGSKLGIEPHLILSKEQIRQYVYEKDHSALRDWQKELLSISF